MQHDEVSADSVLTAALEPDAAMQTLGQRLVWTARADLALERSDPHLALHITDQLLASAVGLSSESSIPRLAKGTAIGHGGEFDQPQRTHFRRVFSSLECTDSCNASPKRPVSMHLLSSS